jgi:hypothetical protein
LLIPLKKGTLWKVTKDTIDTKNEELFSGARSRSKSPNPRFCIRKKHHEPTKKEKKLRQKEIQE